VNRTLLPRDRGDRNANPSRVSRSARPVPGVGGLVCRVAAVAREPRVGHWFATVGARSFARLRLGLTAKVVLSLAKERAEVTTCVR
jgi:hypothetical protein